jgi:dephospho-CoA kinase
MLLVALTGNVASGKSRVADLFRRWGGTIVDADALVRELQAPGSPVLAAIAARFGPQVVRPDGTLDRDRLRALILADPEARSALNAIVHPAVERLTRERIAAARDRGDRIVVCEIPLLFEVRDPGHFDAVVLVDAPEATRLTRLRTTRGLSDEEARRLMALQLPAAAKRAWRGGPGNRSPFVIENDGDLPTLERRARAVWDELERLATAQT